MNLNQSTVFVRKNDISQFGFWSRFGPKAEDWEPVSTSDSDVCDYETGMLRRRSKSR